MLPAYVLHIFQICARPRKLCATQPKPYASFWKLCRKMCNASFRRCAAPKWYAFLPKDAIYHSFKTCPESVGVCMSFCIQRVAMKNAWWKYHVKRWEFKLCLPSNWGEVVMTIILIASNKLQGMLTNQSAAKWHQNAYHQWHALPHYAKQTRQNAHFVGSYVGGMRGWGRRRGWGSPPQAGLRTPGPYSVRIRPA